jgi:hypothetical protein
LDLEVHAGWVSPSSRGLLGGNALLLSNGALLETPRCLMTLHSINTLSLYRGSRVGTRVA